MYIVTDLTRFGAGNPNVCTALVELSTGRCVRPMPYFSYALVREHNVIPGAKFSGSFIASSSASAPHFEDCDYSDLQLIGPAQCVEFETALSQTTASSICEGLEYQFTVGQKVVPAGSGGGRSITTIEVDPSTVEVLPDQYNDQKIKISFRDGSGQSYRYLPITDLGFHDYAIGHRDGASLMALNAHIRNSQKVVMRIGLSRRYKQSDRDGYWLQVNGIYTFPSKLEVVRGYR